MKISTLNKRLTALKGFLSKGAFSKVLDNLNIPSKDLFTKSGNITTSKKKWAEYGEALKTLESKSVPTVRELKSGTATNTKIIDKLNNRLTALRNFLDKDAYDIVKKQLNLPSTDLFTKSGNITKDTSKWAEYSELELKALEKKDLPTLKQLKADAKESLENSGVMETLSSKAEIEENIRIEASAMFKINGKFEEAVNEWYDFVNSFGVELSFEFPEIDKLDLELYSKGQKSYMELEGWMNRAQEVINKALRG